MAYWILGHFDLFDPDMVIIAAEAVMVALIWLLFLASAIFFEKIFAKLAWENLFLFIVGFPTLMHIFYGSIFYLNYLELGDNYGLSFQGFQYNFIDLDTIFLYLLPVFFIAYLIHFIRRLRRSRKEKDTVSTENS